MHAHEITEIHLSPDTTWHESMTVMSIGKISRGGDKSTSSCNSKASTVSSALRKAEAKRAALLVRAAAMRKRHELAKEEAKIQAEIQAKKEALGLEIEIAAASAEIETLGFYGEG